MKELATRVARYQEMKKQARRKNITRACVAATVLTAAPAATVFFHSDVTLAETTQSSFINQISQSAVSVAANNDLYASVMIAQAMVETGYGSSTLSNAPYYNLFGVKEYGTAAKVYMPTQEYLNGQYVTMNEPFRQYSSYAESFAHQASILTSRYQGALKSHTYSYQDATAYLTGRYATAPNYAAVLNQVIAQYNLTQFDTGGSATAVTTTTATTTTQTATTATTTATGGSYTVKSGDTLWDIASAHGLSVDQLMANNGLTSDYIAIGQTLTV